MYKKLEKRKIIDGKIYCYSQGFTSRADAKTCAERKRKDWGLKARVVEGKTTCTHKGGKNKSLWRVYTRK